jgi:UDP-N-acetylglucosamine 2-epimerase
VRPAAVCLYAESSGWGRAVLTACRAASVPTLAIQHGIIYPKYYSYRHDPDEGDCPRPERTAVFGAAARRFLMERGGYAPDSLALTGSPRFDELVASAREADRQAQRARLGVGTDERLLVVASRFRGIRATHQSIGSAFGALLRAVEALPGVLCLVKPHPAEPAEPYARCVREAGAAKTRVLAATSNLLELLNACDALVTVESLSAVEALVLGRPVVVLNTPTNLAELLEAGVALGVPVGADPTQTLRQALFDPAQRERLEVARGRYLSDLAMGVDGRATERILDLLRETAGGGAAAAGSARGSPTGGGAAGGGSAGSGSSGGS